MLSREYPVYLVDILHLVQAEGHLDPLALILAVDGILGPDKFQEPVEDPVGETLVDRAQQYSRGGTDIDDQSLKSFLDRIGRSSHFVVSGISVDDRREVKWEWPWELSTRSIYWATAAAAVLIGLWIVYSWIRCRNRDPAVALYSLMLFTLIFFPNIQRYNHLLALPVMAWLWNNGTQGRRLAIAAYALFALSRLNHIWAVLLPSPLAPIASGFGLFGIFILLGGITYFLHSTDRRIQ